MNRNAKPALTSMKNEQSHTYTGRSCPECEEQSDLKMLVAELLYRNQVLRFDLIEARDQVERFERARAAGYGTRSTR
jgi:type II secretory ATPase GspE/PulE/Tfp pilus assembly ATPase PilB-like protein